MKVLVTSTNEEDPIKIEGATVVKTLNVNFSNTHGQLTPQSRVESNSNSNSSKMLWLSFEGARVATIQNIDFLNT